jgi:pyroglutamyl-peptidase
VLGGRAALRSSAPTADLLGALRRHSIPARLSRDAGRYLCNYAYWRALEHARHGRPLIQFVHIPAVRSGPRRRTSRTRHSLSFGPLVAAAEALLVALIAATRR